jgi:hypothetical protein
MGGDVGGFFAGAAGGFFAGGALLVGFFSICCVMTGAFVGEGNGSAGCVTSVEFVGDCPSCVSPI